MVIKGNALRILLTKSRIDGHDRGVRYLARKLMEAGMEVVFTRYASAQEIVSSAMQEDVDVIGISMSVGRPSRVTAEVMRLLKQNHLDNILVMVGGVIPEVEIPELEKMGVTEVWGPGSSAADIISYIVSQVKKTEGIH